MEDDVSLSIIIPNRNLKLLFGFIGVISFHSICSAAYNTTSHKFPIITVRFIRFWKKVTSYTMRFLFVDCRNAVCPQNIIALFNEFYMLWITARRVVTNNMIKDIHTSIFWKWLNKKFVEYPVSSVCFSPQSYSSISPSFSTDPIPTLSFRVNRYFRKEPLFFFIGKDYF